jgi:hypothetical protein
MHNTVGTIFKVLGISIIMMLLLDILYIVGDTLAVNSRVTSVAGVMQDEVSRNNCIPNSIKPLFISQLNTIKGSSNVVKGIKTNISNSLTVDGKTYDSLSESNVKGYGTLLTLIIQIEMEPKSLIVYKGAGQNNGSFLGRGAFTYTQTYKYQVPALRYLK